MGRRLCRRGMRLGGRERRVSWQEGGGDWGSRKEEGERNKRKDKLNFSI